MIDITVDCKGNSGYSSPEGFHELGGVIFEIDYKDIYDIGVFSCNEFTFGKTIGDICNTWKSSGFKFQFYSFGIVGAITICKSGHNVFPSPIICNGNMLNKMPVCLFVKYKVKVIDVQEIIYKKFSLN